jgi:hypothetical protein
LGCEYEGGVASAMGNAGGSDPTVTVAVATGTPGSASLVWPESRRKPRAVPTKTITATQMMTIPMRNCRSLRRGVAAAGVWDAEAGKGIEGARVSSKGRGWFLGFFGARTGAVMSRTLLISPSLEKFCNLSIKPVVLLPCSV